MAFLSQIILHPVFQSYGDSFSGAHLGQKMEVLGLLIPFITTVSATSLIALKIILVTHRSQRQRHYAKVIEILVESAAMVSIVILGTAILALMATISPFDLSTTRGKVCWQLYNYLLFVQLPITVSKVCCSDSGCIY